MRSSAFFVSAVVVLAPLGLAQTEIETEVVVQVGTVPHQVLHAPGDRDRLFIAEQHGYVHIVENGTLLPTPFLDISGQILINSADGLNGVAFHPDYANNGWLFVLYSTLSSTTQLSRFTVSASDPNQIDPNSELFLFDIPQPAGGHSGGNPIFGPEGLLWIAVGDGGLQGDPMNFSQNPSVLLGKMLRIDVDQPPYGIPPDNIGAQTPGMRDEIWAIGLRSPWRSCFDRKTGDLFIADVGQNTWEEINYVRNSPSTGFPTGLNFGWRLMEGLHCYVPSTNCNPNNDLQLPVFEYMHAVVGSLFRCSVTGGHVYRGRSMARMHGRYFFGDYCSGELFSLHWDPVAQQVVFENHLPQTGTIGAITGFGEDLDGEIYVCTDTGTRRLVPKGLRLDLPKMTAGASVTATISGAFPNSQVSMYYSRIGLGSTPLPVFGVTLDLNTGAFLAMMNTDPAGAASLTRLVPNALSGRTLWIQIAEPGNTSNVVVDTVD